MIPATRHPWTKIRMMPAERDPEKQLGYLAFIDIDTGLGGHF
jgi:hypothetical protein